MINFSASMPWQKEICTEYAGMYTDASKICIGAFGMEAHAVEMRLRAVLTMVCSFGMESDAGGTNAGAGGIEPRAAGKRVDADGMGTQAGRMGINDPHPASPLKGRGEAEFLLSSKGEG